MLPLISVLTQFLLVALVVTAAVLGIAVGYFYVQARRAEREAPALSAPDRAELRQRDAEITAIRARIEEIYQRQQTGNETQHQIVQQQLEQVQQHLKARARQIEGLQSQLRHEMQQRDEAMAELRARLEEAIHTGALAASRTLPQPAAEPAPALPPAETFAPARPEPSAEPEAPARSLSPQPPPAVEAPVSEPDETPAPGWSWEPIELDFRLDVDDPEEAGLPVSGDGRAGASQDDLLALFGLGEGEHEADEEPIPVYFPVSDLLGDDADEEASEDDPKDALAAILQDPGSAPTPTGPASAAGHSTPRAGEATSLAEEDALDGLVQWTLLDLPPAEGEGTAPATAQAVAPTPQAETPYAGGDGMADASEAQAGPAVPPGAEALTILPAVDEARQATLYRLGVRTVEEVARWTRDDARRIAEALEGVSEDDIMTDWVFEAQSVLFDRYQRGLQSRRPSA